MRVKTCFLNRCSISKKIIYLDIFKRLEAANTLLTNATNVVGASDLVFNGNAAQWRKFGNSLYLRLLMRLSGKAEVTALVQAKNKDLVDNTDAAVLRWTETGALISLFVNGVRKQDWRAPAISLFFIDNLSKWVDLRLFQGAWLIA